MCFLHCVHVQILSQYDFSKMAFCHDVNADNYFDDAMCTCDFTHACMCLICVMMCKMHKMYVRNAFKNNQYLCNISKNLPIYKKNIRFKILQKLYSIYRTHTHMCMYTCTHMCMYTRTHTHKSFPHMDHQKIDILT